MTPTRPPEEPTPSKPAAAREHLAKAKGRAFWRNLEELASADESGRRVRREFPRLVPSLESVDRREFIKLMGASMALGGMAACTKQPIEKIVPFTSPPEEGVPGKPLFFASAFTLAGYGIGVLAESHLGRPTKIEGNPNHPASRGATDCFTQASILDLYDVDRSQNVRKSGRPSSWPTFLAGLEQALGTTEGGQGLRVLTGNVTSPTLGAQLKALLAKFPEARWHQFEPVNRDAVLAGALQAFGRPVDTVYDFTQANVVVSLDADFLVGLPAFTRYAQDVASRRTPGEQFDHMNRMYAFEVCPSVTGTAADHRIPVNYTQVDAVARAIAARVGVAVNGPELPADVAKVLNIAIEDLQAQHGKAVVVPGDDQPAAVHALAHAINQKLGAVGTTVTYIDPVAVEPVSHVASISELVAAMRAGEVKLLVMLDTNPVFTAPADLDFAGALEKVETRVHLGAQFDETARLCHWHVPAAHYLEAWSDVRAFDGTASVVQPLILPLFQARSPHDILAAMLGEGGTPGYDIVRATWIGKLGGDDPDKAWRKVLHEGVIPGTRAPAIAPTLTGQFADAAPAGEGIEIVFRADPAVFDGRFANNGWLQELPRPITKMTWDNAALMSPAMAHQLVVGNRLDDADRVTIAVGEKTFTLPVLVVPGHAANTVTVNLGYGRKYGGRVMGDSKSPIGLDLYPYRTTAAMTLVRGAKVSRARGTHLLATTQHHPTIEETPGTKGRHLIRTGTVGEYAHHPEHPAFVHPIHVPEGTLYEGYDYSKGNKWGMVINLSACIGCNACTIACQAENNIPVVGKMEVLKGRELHWIRVDRYYQGGAENPITYHQPMACVHCENAPCETVCPVGATNHSAEGLNQMVYNRCVGTRYCSNNCPYKTRRFNFFPYADHKTEMAKFQRNPDVTVRSRGVMEKCSYCVQRINAARIEAKKDGNRMIRDGEVITACQQACPTRAITFGNLNDPDAAVTQAKQSPLNYGVLSELNTVPRTTYHARITNPHPALAGDDGAHPSAPAPASESHEGSLHG